jgi:hypothetical protein
MIRRARILAEASALDYSDRYGMPRDHQGRGRTLESYRRRFGGSLTGVIDAPFGGPQEISLDAFSGHAPETYIDIRFVVPWAGTDFPSDYSDAVVLKEYEFED